MRRREFLKSVPAIAGASVFADLGSSSRAQSTRGRRDGWATLPDSGGIWPGGSPVGRILEIYLYGGVSPWETFYVNPATARGGTCAGSACVSGTTASSDLQWGTFQCAFENILRNVRGSRTAITHALTPSVSLGPPTYPLWSRADLLSRLRVLVTTHDLLPHEAAIPYALTGSRLGRPTHAGTGAAIMRAFPTESGAPAAYVLEPLGSIDSARFLSASATGTHGAGAAPLHFRFPGGTFGLDVLTRSRRAGAEQLLAYYRDRYGERLTWPGRPRTRSAALDSYEAVLNYYFRSNEIGAEIEAYDPSISVPPGAPPLACLPGSGASQTRAALNFASFLLRQPNTRYVSVIDKGGDMGGYDTHTGLPERTFRNLQHTLELLAALTTGTVNPIPEDTLIVLNTEFGRKPAGDGTGRDHWPQSYTNVILPPRPPAGSTLRLAGNTVVGGIHPSGELFVPSGQPIAAVTPTDLRAALLLALEIDPFDDSNFAVGSLSEYFRASTHAAGYTTLRETLLGYSVTS